MNRFKFIISTLLLFTVHTGIWGQAITATPVEEWVTEDYPNSDFNLNSAYVYLINGHQLGNVFSGDGLNRSERKMLDIKKGDYPKYMYLAVSIQNPMKQGDDLTIPLMIHDVRDPSNASNVIEYGGRFLENIPDEVLKDGDIVAKVKFEAIKASGTSEFWQKATQISIDLGKTATSLVAAPLSFLTMTNQVLPQVSKGLNTLEEVGSKGKMTSEFYIRLLNKEMSALFQERVVSATLYKIHWDVDKTRDTDYYSELKTAGQVDDLRRLITSRNNSYILVVQTKAEYNTDHSELAYNQQYIARKSKDYRRIRNLEKKEVEKEFLEVLKMALELKKQIETFNNSMATKYRDWQAFSKMIDLYYDVRLLKEEQVAELVNIQDPLIKDKYNRLYANVINDIDLWFTSELLTRARSIASYLADYRGYVGYSTLDARTLYEHIELLNFYRDRVRQTEIQGKIPKEIESLETYLITKKQLQMIESALFDKAFQVPRGVVASAKKHMLINMASNQYPLCELCGEKVQEKIAEIDNATYTENVNRYVRISADYYNNLSCYDNIYQKLDSFIRVNTDSLQVSPFMLTAMQKDKEELTGLFDTYGKIASQDYQALKPKELSDLLSEYDLTREKLVVLLQRLEGVIYDREDLPCFYAKP
jgi:hypothetical protein